MSSSKGWRASRRIILRVPGALRRGTTHRNRARTSAFANSSSSSPSAAAVAAISTAWARNRPVNSRKMRCTSRNSSSRNAPVRYSGRWFQAARRTAYARCRSRRESRRPPFAPAPSPPEPQSDRCGWSRNPPAACRPRDARARSARAKSGSGHAASPFPAYRASATLA